MYHTVLSKLQSRIKEVEYYTLHCKICSGKMNTTGALCKGIHSQELAET